MKRMTIFGCMAALSAALAIQAAPSISGVKCVQRSQGYRVSYTLSGEPAVVTAEFFLNGESIAANLQTNMSGAVNALVPVGTASFHWFPSTTPTDQPQQITVTLRAWATNTPPDYMVIDLNNPTAGAKYYTSVDRLPADISASCWRTDFLVMRKIPAACREWRAGYLPSSDAFESKPRFVTLSSDYYLGVFPITVGQYAIMSAKAGSPERKNSYISDYGITVDPEWPKGQMSYEYFRGRRPLATTSPGSVFWPASGHASIDQTADLAYFRNTYGVPFDLPTEAEWEFACRGGIETNVTANVAGATLGDVAWYAGNSSATVTTNGGQTVSLYVPHRVGTKLQNGYGLYDMLGNIYEFCLDWYEAAPDMPERALDPVGPSQETTSTAPGFANPLRVRRGGSFLSASSVCRPSAREGYNFTYDAAGSPTEKAALLVKYQNGARLWAPAAAIK